MIRASKVTFNLFDILEILLLKFRNHSLVGRAGESLQRNS